MRICNLLVTFVVSWVPVYSLLGLSISVLFLSPKCPHVFKHSINQHNWELYCVIPCSLQSLRPPFTDVLIRPGRILAILVSLDSNDLQKQENLLSPLLYHSFSLLLVFYLGSGDLNRDKFLTINLSHSQRCFHSAIQSYDNYTFKRWPFKNSVLSFIKNTSFDLLSQ